MPADFETLLRCPDCHGGLARDAAGTLLCAACGYRAPLEGGVYNLLPSAERAELYPGDRDDAIDFSLAGHAGRLGEGWHELEGEFGNKYRWMGARASARLRAQRSGPQRLRVRGYAHAAQFQLGRPCWSSFSPTDRAWSSRASTAPECSSSKPMCRTLPNTL